MSKAFRAISFLITAILCLVTMKSVAQNGFEDGYIVTNTNDTLYGKVRDRKTGAFGKLYKKVKFKGKKGKSKYSPKEIVTYKIGQTLFESLPLVRGGSFFDDEYKVSPEGDFRFLKVVQKGSLSYYQLEFEDSDSGYIDNIGYFKKQNSNLLVRVSQGLFGLKRKKLAAFFSDCPELSQNIQRKRIKDPIEIVHFYNNWKVNNQ